MRQIKLLISLGFFAVCWLRDSALRLVKRKARSTCVILYYHAVPADQRSRFAQQMDDLIRWAKPVCADVQAPLPGKGRYAAVTFDDAYENIVKNAVLALKERRIPSTIFVVTEALGESPRWNDPSAGSDRERAVMSADQLRHVVGELVSVGSHSLTHPMLPNLTIDKAKFELSESRRKLEEILGQPIRLFSFPYGAFNQNLVAWCREAGYERVFATSHVQVLSELKEFVVGRLRVDPTDWRLEFRLKLLGAYRWLPWAFALKRKIFGRRTESERTAKQEFSAPASTKVPG